MRDPFSLEAEHGVLGAMLLRNELIDVLSAELTPEDFYWPENGDLYRAMEMTFWLPQAQTALAQVRG